MPWQKRPFQSSLRRKESSRCCCGSSNKAWIVFKEHSAKKKKLLFVPLPPSSQRRSSRAHVPPTPSSPSRACLVWDVLCHQPAGRKARLLQLQEHIYGLSLGVEVSGGKEEQPWSSNSCNNRVGAPFKRCLMDGGCKITQAEQRTHIPGYPQHSQLLLFPHSIFQRISKRSLTFPVQGESGRSF